MDNKEKPQEVYMDLMANMDNKETGEAMAILTLFINGGYASMEDGVFKFLNDIPKFIPAFMAIQPGVDGFSNIKEENAFMSIPGREQLIDQTKALLSAAPSDDAWDIAHLLNGLLAGVRLGQRKGIEAGRKALIEELRAGKVTVEQLLKGEAS